MKKKHSILFLAIGLLASGVARADVAPETELKMYTGEEVVVTATKTLNSVSDSGGSSVTVITSEDIENSGQVTVEDVISTTVGVDIVRNGSLGNQSSLFLRGADTKYTLLLIDGVPANDPADGTRSPNMSNLTVDNVERIEIVRGPVSVLYGSSAMAGVINIITKKGGDKPGYTAGVEGGSYGTWKAYAGTYGKSAGVDYSFLVSRLASRGFSTTDENNRCINPDGESFENDGYENTTLSGAVDIKLDENTKLQTVFRYTDAESEYDSPGVDEDGNEQEAEQVSSRIALVSRYESSLSTFSYSFSSQDRDYLEDGDLSSTYHGFMYEVGWQNDIALFEDNTLSIGLTHQRESIDQESFGRYASAIDNSVDANSAFIEDQWVVKDITLVGGIRYEDNENFGGNTTWRIAPSYKVENTTLKFSYATGFRAPSLYELYSKYGNENLKEEKSAGWDAGFEHTIKSNIKFGSTYFRTDYDDRIEFDQTSWVYDQQEGKTKTQGVESFLEWSPSDLLFFMLNHTYTYTQDANDEELRRRPRNKVALTGTYNVSPEVTLTTAMQWVGSRRDPGAENDACEVTDKLESYFLIGLGGSYQLNEHVKLYGRIDNLFDEYYEEAWRYATPGRSAYAGVKFVY